MALSDCLNVAVAGGAISRDTADRAAEQYDALVDDLVTNGKLSFHEAKTRAAQAIEDDLERARVRKKRARILQAAKWQGDIAPRIAAAPAGSKEKAALSLLEFDPSGKFSGENVVARHTSIRGEAWAIGSDLLAKFRSRAAGLHRDTTELPQVVRALFGEASTESAKRLADAYTGMRKFVVQRFNAAGGDIRMRSDWGLPQHHDRELIKAAGKDAWLEFTVPRLDPEKMRDASGQPLTARQVRMAAEAAFDEIVAFTPQQRAHLMTSPAAKYIAHRNLAFTNADTWMEYQQRFGSGDIFAALVGDIDRLARDAAVLEVLGPYPRATIENLADIVTQDGGNPAFLRSVFDVSTGASAVPVNEGFAQFNQSWRNLSTAAKLGSAVINSVSDFFTAHVTSRFNGLPQTRVMAEYVKQLSDDGNRRMAARLGYMHESWIGDLVAAQRMLGEVAGVAKTARFADNVLRASGLTAHTEALRNAWRISLNGHLTDAATMPWERLSPENRQMMERFGITADDWNLFRDTPIFTDRETGAEFIRPQDVWLEYRDMRLPQAEREARFTAAQKFSDMINSESLFAVPIPTARSRALMQGIGFSHVTKPGTILGEALRHFTLFRSWTASIIYLHGSRFRSIDGGLNKVAYAAHVAIPLVLAGAAVTQFSNIARGRDPLDMTTPEFWGTAAIRGGAFGPFGDLLMASETRFGGGFFNSIIGPSASDLINLVRVLQNAGERDNLPADLRRFAESLTPGNSLWYTRTVFDRMVKDQLEELFDPGAHARWRRMESRARTEHGQRFWWRPGHTSPERAPDMTSAAPFIQ